MSGLGNAIFSRHCGRLDGRQRAVELGYNGIPSGLSVIPAIEAGLSDHGWTISELVILQELATKQTAR